MSDKYLTFTQDGEIQQRLIAGVCDIPDDAVNVTDELWTASANDTTGRWLFKNGALIKVPFPEVEPDHAQLIAAERFKREATGINVGGLLIETTRDSQALIASTGLSAVLDPDYRCNFKTVAGFVNIGAEQIITIAKAVREHVQACFDREFALLRALDAGEYHEAMLGQGWPDLATDTV